MSKKTAEQRFRDKLLKEQADDAKRCIWWWDIPAYCQTNAYGPHGGILAGEISRKKRRKKGNK